MKNGNKWRMFGLPIAVASAMLAGAVAWGQLDLPRPAWHSEVKALTLQVAANTQLILGDKWLRLTSQIKALVDKLASNPSNRRALIAELAVKQLQLREVNRKLK